jgi:hypothetical protein
MDNYVILRFKRLANLYILNYNDKPININYQVRVVLYIYIKHNITGSLKHPLTADEAKNCQASWL